MDRDELLNVNPAKTTILTLADSYTRKISALGPSP